MKCIGRMVDTTQENLNMVYRMGEWIVLTEYLEYNLMQTCCSFISSNSLVSEHWEVEGMVDWTRRTLCGSENMIHILQCSAQHDFAFFGVKQSLMVNITGHISIKQSYHLAKWQIVWLATGGLLIENNWSNLYVLINKDYQKYLIK